MFSKTAISLYVLENSDIAAHSALTNFVLYVLDPEFAEKLYVSILVFYGISIRVFPYFPYKKRVNLLSRSRLYLGINDWRLWS